MAEEVNSATRFYRAWLRRAFAGWFKRVQGWTGTVALLVGVALFIFTSPQGAEKIGSTIRIVFFLTVFGAISITRLALAPYWLYREERNARVKAERARLPKLQVSLPEPAVIQSVSLRANTSESLGGTRQTVITGWELDVVALLCTNLGETTAKNCRARLLAATRLSPDGEHALQVVESVELPWNKEDPEHNLSTDIAPADKRHIWIGGVRSRGHFWLFRDIKSLPIEYQRLLGEPGSYRILLQIDGENIPPQQVLLGIVAAEGPKPEHGIWRGSVDVTLMGEGAPRVEDALIFR